MTAPPVTLYTTPPVAVAAQQWTDITKGDQITIARITSITSTYAVDTSVQPLMTTAMVQSLVYPTMTYALLPNQWVVVGSNFEQAMDDATFKALYTVVGAGHVIAAAGGPDPGGPLTVSLRVYANFAGNLTITWGDGTSNPLTVAVGALAIITHTYAAGAVYTIVVKETAGAAVTALTYAAYAAPVSPVIDSTFVLGAAGSGGSASVGGTSGDTVPLTSGIPITMYTGTGSESAAATPIETMTDVGPDQLADMSEPGGA